MTFGHYVLDGDPVGARRISVVLETLLPCQIPGRPAQFGGDVASPWSVPRLVAVRAEEAVVGAGALLVEEQFVHHAAVGAFGSAVM